MTHLWSKHSDRISMNRYIQYVIGTMIVLVMSNLSAIVDAFFHPEIFYFDQEHLIVGGITGFVSGILVILVIRYLRRLEKAVNEIRILESVMPLCAHCRKTRRPGADPNKRESWLPLESYLSETARTHFSHGICPECLAKYYSDITQEKDNPPEPEHSLD